MNVLHPQHPDRCLIAYVLEAQKQGNSLRQIANAYGVPLEDVHRVVTEWLERR